MHLLDLSEGMHMLYTRFTFALTATDCSTFCCHQTLKEYGVQFRARSSAVLFYDSAQACVGVAVREECTGLGTAMSEVY